MADNYAKHLVRGSVWMIAARWIMRVIGLMSTLILARLLTPADFGVIAIALIVIGLLETIASAAVDLALLREGNETREHYDTAWTIQVIQGVIVGALLLAAAPFAASYFSEPRAVAVIQLMALRCAINGAQNIGIVAFRKELDFAKEFRFMLYQKLINFVILVGAAYFLRSYWALAIGMTSWGAISVMLSYAMHPYRPRFSLAKVNEIWSFSQWLLLSRIGAFLNRRTDEFVVGGMVGTAAMGSYHVASELSTMPTNELVMPMRRAMFPTLAKLEGDARGFGNAMLTTFSSIAVVCLAVGFGLMSVAPELVRLFLGEKWLQAEPLIQWLALFGGVSSLVLVLEVPLWVSGRTHFSALQTWLELALLVPVVWLATKTFGIEGAAAARTLVSCSMVPVMMYLVARAGHLRMGQLLAVLWRPLVAGVAMALVLHALPVAALPVALALLLKIAVGALIYIAIVAGLWLVQGRPEGFEASILRQIKTRLGARAARQ